MFEKLFEDPHYSSRLDRVPALGYLTHRFRDRRDNTIHRNYFERASHLEFVEYHLLMLFYISFTTTNALIATQLWPHVTNAIQNNFR